MPVRTLASGGGVTGDFSSISSWWAALPSTFTEDETLQVRWASSANEISVPSETDYTGKAFGGFRLTIEPYPGEGFADHASKNTNPLRYNASVGACIRTTTNGAKALSIAPASGPSRITIRGLQFKTEGSNYRGAPIRLHRVTETIVENNICEHQMNGGFALEFWSGAAVSNQAQYSTLRNNVCIALHANGSGISVNRADGSWDKTNIFDNTCVNIPGGGTGIGITTVNGYIDYVIANNLVAGFNTDCFVVNPPAGAASPVAIRSTNGTDKTSGTTGFGSSGTNQYSVVKSTTFENVTAGTHDLRLKNNATHGLAAATNSYGVSTDILGNPQSGLRDLGAHENQNQGAAPNFWFIMRRSPTNAGFVNCDFPRIR